MNKKAFTKAMNNTSFAKSLTEKSLLKAHRKMRDSLKEGVSLDSDAFENMCRTSGENIIENYKHFSKETKLALSDVVEVVLETLNVAAHVHRAHYHGLIDNNGNFETLNI